MLAQGLPIQGEDDAAAIQGLAQQFRQFQQMLPYAQQYMQIAPQLSDFQKWQKEQQEAARARTPDPDPWEELGWKPPEFNREWLNQVHQDQATGEWRGPPHLVAKVQEYQLYRQQQLAKFGDNPYQFMAPAIEKLAEKKFQAMLDTRFKQVDDQNWAKQYLQNTSWLYEYDPQGNPVQQMNPITGQADRVLSGPGKRFLSYCEEAGRKGIADVHLQQEYAEAKTKNEYWNDLVVRAAKGEQVARDQVMQFIGMQGSAPAVPPPDPLKQGNEQWLQQQQQQKKPKPPERNRMEPALQPARTFADLFYQERAKENGGPIPQGPTLYPKL